MRPLTVLSSMALWGLLGCGGTPLDAQPEKPGEPTDTAVWALVWQDEFDGQALDGNKWSIQVGDGCDQGICGWGNNELQWYQASNVRVANGVLSISARRESVGGKPYTSARIRTAGKGDWKYARVEVRAKLPVGRGMWPAVWMLPTDNVYGTWAASGEIDIVELVGHEPATVHGTLHYGGTWPNNRSSGAPYTLSTGTLADDFHTFAVEWERGVIRWFVDGKLYQTQTQWSTAGFAFPAPFDQRFHLLINLAVGGNWPGNPDATTVFPQDLVVDWIRVHQRQ